MRGKSRGEFVGRVGADAETASGRSGSGLLCALADAVAGDGWGGTLT